MQLNEKLELASTNLNLNETNQNHFQSVSHLYHQQHIKRQGDVSFWRQFALEIGGPILELGCGTGRILLPLAEAGLHVTGIDSSEMMLTQLNNYRNELSQETSDRINLIHGTFPDAIPDKKFKQVFLTFGILQFVLTNHEEILGKIYNALLPDGRLIIDIRNYGFKKGLGTVAKPIKSFNAHPYEARFQKFISYDSEEQLIYEKYNWKVRNILNGSRNEFQTMQVMRVFYRFELEYLLRLCGFKVMGLYGNYELGPISAERTEQSSKRFIFIAQTY